MIVTCERCQTRFELDDAKVPASGARVRCSRCRHSFLVQPGAGGDGETQVVASAAPAPRPGARKAAPRAAADDATRVLSAPPAGAAPGPRREGGDEESDWQFNEEPSGKPSPARRAPAAPLREFLAPSREEAPSLEQLGDPESWDLVGGDESGETTVARVRPQPPAGPQSAPQPAPPAARAPVPTAPAAVAVPAPAPVALEEGAASAPGPEPWAPGARAAGWAATLALAAAVAHASLVPPAPRVAAPAAPIRSGALAVRQLAVRRLDNAFGQRLLVVAGQLANEGDQMLTPGTGLRLTLLGDDGEPLPGATAAAAAAPGEERLRTQASDDLLADGGWRASMLAWTPLAAHGSSEFAAVVFDPPTAASRFRLELAPPPPPPGPPAPPAAEATAPSPPPPLPSSG